MKRNLFFCILGIVLAALLWGCRTDIKYSEDHHFEKTGWSHTDTIAFDITNAPPLIEDADVILFIRNSNTYRYRNIYLGVRIESPSGVADNKVIQLQLADERGLWKGKGWTTLFTNEYIIKRGFEFDEKGDYRISITHRMRDDLLLGIDDVGIYVKSPQNSSL